MYKLGDLFLMPSSFEPCGISQMLAMREGQPCLVHGVGGLADTVIDNETGFVFHGDSPASQASALLVRLGQVLELRNSAAAWQAVCKSAAEARFSWDSAAEAYEAHLYR